MYSPNADCDRLSPAVFLGFSLMADERSCAAVTGKRHSKKLYK